MRNAHNRADIEEDCTAKITEYANRGFRGLGIAKAPGDGSRECGHGTRVGKGPRARTRGQAGKGLARGPGDRRRAGTQRFASAACTSSHA